MSSLKEKERAKEQQEKFQAILSALLKDEDNKYCVDCDAKGPRWASWNLGIFLCIRCAGIHRNLGVHISKVKSVNLDTWTPEQVAMMQEIGNSRGRAVYEANIPDGFRRPQTDSALEAFIRSKYEHKKYIAREWVPPKPTVPKEWLEDPKAEKKRARSKPTSTVQIPAVGKIASKPTVTAPAETAKPAQGAKPEIKPQPKPNAASNDLLGLDLGAPQTHTQQATAPAQPSGGNELLDLFGGPQTSQPQGNAPSAPASNSDLMNGTSSEGNLFIEEKAAAGEEKKASTKDSIMALFGGGGSGGGGGGASQPQMYGVPDPRFVHYMYQHHGGVYMPQGQQMYPNMPGQQQGMMAPQGMMGQPQGMMGQPQGMMGQQGMMGHNQGMGMMGQQGNMRPPQQGMMGQPQGMMGNPAMNGQQAAMYNGQQGMGANPGMYTPQQMQQLQFHQMQQQMTALNVGGPQMGGMPQQATSAPSGWGNPGQGQTLSTNLWQ